MFVLKICYCFGNTVIELQPELWAEIDSAGQNLSPETPGSYLDGYLGGTK